MKPSQASRTKPITALGLAAAFHCAGAMADDSQTLDLIAYSGRVTPPTSAYGSSDRQPADTPKKTWDRALPFYAQRVLDQGYSLPEPYDIGLSLFAGRQDLTIDNLQVSFGGAPMHNANFIGFDATDMRTDSVQLQLGAWLFPFLNVYALIGRVSGKGDIGVTMNGRDLMEFLHLPGCGLPARLQPDICKQAIDGTAHASYHGTSYGVGFTLAGAHKQFFFSLPVSYVINDVSISDTPTHALTLMPRVGWTVGLGGYGQITNYVGMTYMYTKNHLTGTFVFPTAGTAIGHDTSLQFDMEQRQAKAWNYLAGAHWSFNRRWSVLGEIGFGETRQDLIVTAFYHF